MTSRTAAAKIGVVLGILAVVSLLSAGTVSAQGFSGFWSAETLQNIGAATADVDVIVYSNENSDTEVVDFPNLEAGEGKTILPDSIAAPGDPSVADITSGSAVISSDQPLVAIVGLTNQPIPSAGLGISGGTSAGVYEGSGVNEISSTLLFPIAKKEYFGQSTLYYIQNAGGSTANVKATFTWQGGSAESTVDIEPNRSKAIGPPASMPAGTLGSAQVESTNSQNLAGAVFEIDLGVPSKAHKTGRSFSTNDLQGEMFVPSFKKSYFGNDSNIGIQSPGGSVSGSIIYTCSDAAAGGCTIGSQFTVNFTTPGAGETYNAWPHNPDHTALPGNSLYSAEVEINGGNTAVANVGETGALSGKDEESLYFGPSNSQAAMSWACPIHKEKYFDGAGGTIIQPLEYPAIVQVEFFVNDSVNGQFEGNTYRIKDLVINSGNAVLYDVANGIRPIGVQNLWDGPALPNSTGTSTTLSITSDKNLVVVSNEAIHFSSSAVFDTRQYNCFPTPAP